MTFRLWLLDKIIDSDIVNWYDWFIDSKEQYTSKQVLLFMQYILLFF